jgi:hypothetical protein
MSNKQYGEIKIMEDAEAIAHAAERLHDLSMAARVLGLTILSEDLLGIARGLIRNSEAIKDKAQTLIHQSVARAEQSTNNMMQAILAVQGGKSQEKQ